MMKKEMPEESRPYPRWSTARNRRPDSVAAAGIVRIHAITIFLPNPHLTADNLLVAPTPMIDPEIV
jgi:hypothetical protein